MADLGFGYLARTTTVDTAVKVKAVTLMVGPREGGANKSPFVTIWPS